MHSHEWREFEEEAARFLSLSEFSVTKEKILGHKKIDLYAESYELGKIRRYAVECKRLNRRLDSRKLSIIVSDYASLRERFLIDCLLIVTDQGVSPASQTYIEESRWVHHVTLEELKSSLINFDEYLDDLVSEYEELGLHHYYVPARTARVAPLESAENLTNVVDNWLEAKNGAPLALLGSYGIGKSTFLLHICQHYAKIKKSMPTGRTPILIRLGDISSEQTIDGLLGRYFTSKYRVSGYRFRLFQELNNQGSLLLLLDGFDEMKHSMTRAAFGYTFREILKLVTPCSKVILAGRPTAFLNKHERAEFLHANRYHKGRTVRISGRVGFQEVEMAPFSRTQIFQFVDRYREYLSSLAIEDRKSTDELPTREAFTEHKNIMEIARRPIQLRMLFEVLPAYEGSLDGLGVNELYTFFVDRLLEREARKPSRRQFDANARRSFMESLAFFMWRRRVNKIGIEAVPRFCFPGLQDESAENEDVIRRDYVSGSLLEVTYPDLLIFPHRSIQEYLVASFLLKSMHEKSHARDVWIALKLSRTFDTIEAQLTPEVLDFIVAAAGKRDLRRAIPWLTKTGRELGDSGVRFWTQGNGLAPILVESAKNGNLWSMAVLVIGYLDGVWLQEEGDRWELFEVGLTFLRSSKQIRSAAYYHRVLFLCQVIIARGSLKNQQKWADRLFVTIASTSEHKNYSQFEAFYEVRPAAIVEMLRYFRTSYRKEVFEAGFQVDVSMLNASILTSCQGKIGASKWYAGNNARVPLLTKYTTTLEFQDAANGVFDEEKLMRDKMERASKKRWGRG